MRSKLPLSALMILASLATPSLAAAQPYPPTYMGGFQWAGPEADLRIAVRPREAAVYVDGYFAGKVDDFDGVFQRLHVSPGEHEVVIYLEGHRSLRQRLYLAMNRTHRIDGVLEPLEPGQAAEPPPVPVPQDEDPVEEAGLAPPRNPRNGPPRAPFGRGGPAQPMPPAPPERAGADTRAPLPPSDSRFGTLAIGVRPSDSSITVDGETWEGPSGDEQLIIQLSAGLHTIEVRKDGYDTFRTEVEVERGRTRPLNVSLRRVQ